MKINVYGKIFEVVRNDDHWELYRVGEGKKTRIYDFAIPSELSASEVVTYLADIFHEAAKPCASEVFRVDGPSTEATSDQRDDVIPK